MVTETHTLHLKIDPTQAKAGSKEFTAAIESVKRAVRELDRDSEGLFTKLKSLKPQFDVTPLTLATTEAAKLSTALTLTSTAATKAGNANERAALAASMALRQATTSAQKLAFRLDDMGDAKGLDRLDEAVDRLHAQLRRAPDVAGVRLARNEYENLRTELTQGVTAAEYAKGSLAQLAREQEQAGRAAAQHSAALDALRAEFNPLYSASKAYEATLDRIAVAEREGVISAQLAARAREQAAVTLEGLGRVGSTASKVGYQVQNASYQVGDFFVQVGAGTDATRALAMQLPQLLGGFGVWGAVAGAVAAIMGALVPILLAGGEATRKFDDVVNGLNSTLTTYRDSAAAVNGGTLALREEFGLAAESAQKFHAAMAAVAAMKMEQQLQEGVAALATTMSGVTELWSQWDNATFLPEALRPETVSLTADAVSRLQSEFGLTLTQAHNLSDALTAAKMAKGPEATSAAMQKVVSQLLAAHDAGAKLPPELVKAVEEAATLGLTADRLSAILAPMPSMIGQATGQTNAWALAMSGVRAEINAIMSGLSAIGGGVISNAAKSAEITALKAGKTVKEAAVARERYAFEQRMTAKEMAANAKGGVAGWAENQLIGMERFQFERGLTLDAQLDSEREAARKRETKVTGGGGGGGGGARTTALTEEQKAVEKLNDTLKDRMQSLQEERIALDLVASGQFKTTEAANLMAQAMVQGGGAVDAQTEAMIRQIDAAAKLNEELTKAARDPVREWMASVPNWLEAGKQIETQALSSLSDAIAGMATTGKFDIEALGNSILQTAAKVAADMAVREMVGLFGGNVSGTGTGGFGLGNVLGAMFGGSVGAFSEGGISTRPVGFAPMAAANFHNAPHYAEGTPNTSGIPAVLHPNEAVIPLSRGRKIPVEMGDSAGGGTVVHMPQNITINTPDADSFRRSRKQLAADLAETGQRAVRSIR